MTTAQEELQLALEREHARQRELCAPHELAELRSDQQLELRELAVAGSDHALQLLRSQDAQDLIALIRAGWTPDQIEVWAWEWYG